MALAPIPISGRALTPDITGGIQRGQQINTLQAQQAALQGQEARAQQEAQQLQQQQQRAVEFSEAALRGERIETIPQAAQVFTENPQLVKDLQASADITTQAQSDRLGLFGIQLRQAQGDIPLQNQLIEAHIQGFADRGDPPPKDTIALRNASDKQRAQFAAGAILQGLNAKEIADLAQGGKRGLASAKTEILKDGSVIQALPDGTVQVRDRLGNVVTGQERSDVLDESQQAAIRQLQRKGEVEVTTAGGVAEAKAGVDLRFKPAIEAAVKLAKKEAEAKGESLTTLNQSRAALPGLLETVGTLKELASIATSTLGGKIFDTAVKESGFGTTKGATARAKFIAIINNQVLPLLKPTFGAAFTVSEGDALKATMGDPDASPAEKIAQLEAFIDQKRRSIETSEREIGPPSGKQGGVLNTDAQGNKAFVFPDGSFEEVQ